jgi:hypothetical protein
MTRKTLSGLVCAIALGIAAVAPSAGYADGPLGSACSTDTTARLGPLANVNVKTCDGAVAPTCSEPVFSAPSNPVLRLDVYSCL